MQRKRDSLHNLSPLDHPSKEEVISVAKQKKIKKGNTLDREEFGYGFDISPDDMGVIGKNDNAKKQKKQQKENSDPQRPPVNGWNMLGWKLRIASLAIPGFLIWNIIQMG